MKIILTHFIDFSEDIEKNLKFQKAIETFLNEQKYFRLIFEQFFNLILDQ